MDYTAQNIEYAVSVFYNGEPTDQAKAHTWLTSAQRVPEAWHFVWELLLPTKGTEVQFYAATTLHTKILRCWNEVPPESYDQLQEKLLHAVFTYSKGPKIVTNRLCISLAAFILQQGTIDLATILRPLSSEENTSLLLEVLTVIPEEYNSMTMGSSLRSKNRAALRQACPAVLDDMLRYLQSVYNDYSREPPSEEAMVSWSRAASCACSWLTVDGEEASCAPPLPARMPLCQALLTAVHVLYSCNEIVSDTALDACEACLSAARAAGGAGDASRYPNSALQLLTSLAALAAPIMARDDVPNSPNEDLLSSLITCCVALGSTHARSIVESIERYEQSEASRGARQLLEVLVAAQAAPGHYPIHETRSNLVFGFWYTLQDEILNVMERKTDINGVWREVFSQLLTVLVVKSEAPEAETALSKDDLELLRCYRQDIADSLMYCFAILGEWCWSTVESAYASATSETRREAALHVFLALADAAPHERAPPPLLNMLQHAVLQANTSPDKRTVNTALDCLGSYAAWVSSVEGARGVELARDCVRAAGAALARCPQAAALALRKLCVDCAHHAAHLAPDIVRAAQSSRGGGAWTRRQLVGAAGAALAAAEPAVGRSLLADLAHTIHADLEAQAREPSGSASAGGGAAACAAALSAALCARADLAADLFRMLAPTLPAFAAQPHLVEPLFSILKQTISALMGDCIPLIGDISELTVTALNTSPCAAGLDVVKLIVLVAGNEWEGCRGVLRGGVTSGARGAADARPDLAEGLFVLLTAVTKKRPHYLDWIDDLLPDLFQLGCACIRMWEAGAARAACAWLGAAAGVRPLALQPHAAALTAVALRCIAGATPRNQVEPLAELLLALNRGAWESGGQAAGGGAAAGGGLAAWLRAALAPAGFPSPHATAAHKDAFIAAVIKEKSNKRRLLETVQEFSLVCRGLVGTEYARQSIASKQLIA